MSVILPTRRITNAAIIECLRSLRRDGIDDPNSTYWQLMSEQARREIGRLPLSETDCTTYRDLFDTYFFYILEQTS